MPKSETLEKRSDTFKQPAFVRTFGNVTKASIELSFAKELDLLKKVVVEVDLASAVGLEVQKCEASWALAAHRACASASEVAATIVSVLGDEMHALEAELHERLCSRELEAFGAVSFRLAPPDQPSPEKKNSPR